MELWLTILWDTMGKTGNGYRRHSLHHTGVDGDRRNDKLRDTPEGRIAFNPPESKMVRNARLGRIGVRS